MVLLHIMYIFPDNIFNDRPLNIDIQHKFVDYWPYRQMVWFLLFLELLVGAKNLALQDHKVTE